MRWTDLLSAGVVAGITSVLTLILKEALFPRSLELWRERRNLAATYRRYRDPIVLSAREMGSRAIEIYNDFPTKYLDGKLWDLEDPFDLVHDTSNVHFQKYKLISTVYRLCAFFGWIELYRRDVTFLDAGHDGKNKRLDACIHAIQAVLADGDWNRHADWREWPDRLLFREEQRAIGEAMIRGSGPERSVIGYGAFCKAIEDREPFLTRFVRPVLILVSNTEDRDFRKVRFRETALALVKLIEELDEKQLLYHMRRWRDEVATWRDPTRCWLDRDDLLESARIAPVP
jgi:hypothetical protein